MQSSGNSTGIFAHFSKIIGNGRTQVPADQEISGKIIGNGLSVGGAGRLGWAHAMGKIIGNGFVAATRWFRRSHAEA